MQLSSFRTEKGNAEDELSDVFDVLSGAEEVDLLNLIKEYEETTLNALDSIYQKLNQDIMMNVEKLKNKTFLGIFEKWKYHTQSLSSPYSPQQKVDIECIQTALSEFDALHFERYKMKNFESSEFRKTIECLASHDPDSETARILRKCILLEWNALRQLAETNDKEWKEDNCKIEVFSPTQSGTPC